jgi:hypothetical protein
MAGALAITAVPAVIIRAEAIAVPTTATRGRTTRTAMAVSGAGDRRMATGMSRPRIDMPMAMRSRRGRRFRWGTATKAIPIPTATRASFRLNRKGGSSFIVLTHFLCAKRDLDVSRPLPRGPLTILARGRPA